MSSSLEKAATVLITVSAVTIAVAVAKREMRSPQRSLPAEAPAVSAVSNWNELLGAGRRVGDSAAAVTIVEFSDFECPFCRRFSESLTAARRIHGKKIAHVFVHYPLPNHRFARPAARVAECAAHAGRFSAMHDVLFLKQDSLGLKPWGSFAVEAGITDTISFLRCSRDTTRLEIVERGLRVGAASQVHGTPTVVINGMKYSPTPYDSLTQIVARLLGNPR